MDAGFNVADAFDNLPLSPVFCNGANNQHRAAPAVKAILKHDNIHAKRDAKFSQFAHHSLKRCKRRKRQQKISIFFTESIASGERIEFRGVFNHPFNPSSSAVNKITTISDIALTFSDGRKLHVFQRFHNGRDSSDCHSFAAHLISLVGLWEWSGLFRHHCFYGWGTVVCSMVSPVNRSTATFQTGLISSGKILLAFTLIKRPYLNSLPVYLNRQPPSEDWRGSSADNCEF
nr:MAG TPA: hypothetical protein [Bacteriophage sp.]